jgi:predicted transcriptional regulator of viral defense system
MRKSFEIAKSTFEKNNGILRTSQAKKLGIDPKTLREMVEADILKKEGRGIYRLANLPPLSNPDLIQVALRVPQGIICLISALTFHSLTTQIPYKIYVAVPQFIKKPRIDYPPIEIFNLSKSAYSAGIEVHELDGVNVRIYNKEKTVADCFKFRNKIGQDIAIEALKEYLREPSSDVEKLMYYAGIDRVSKVIRPYVEATI